MTHLSSAITQQSRQEGRTKRDQNFTLQTSRAKSLKHNRPAKQVNHQEPSASCYYQPRPRPERRAGGGTERCGGDAQQQREREGGEQQSARTHTDCPHTHTSSSTGVCVCVCVDFRVSHLSHVVDTSTSGCGDPISPHTAPAQLLTLPSSARIRRSLPARTPSPPQPPLVFKSAAAAAAAFGGNRWRFY